jgi:hypothetical protein
MEFTEGATMATSEETRRHLFQRLEEVLGPEEATTLMEHLPPVGWADVATKRDIDALTVATKRDVDALTVATKRDIDNVRRDIHELAASTSRDIHALAISTSRDIAELATSTSRDIAELATSTSRDFAELATSTRRDFAELATSTSRDTTELGQTLRLEMGALEMRMNGRLERELRVMTWRLITAGIAFGSLLVAAGRL